MSSLGKYLTCFNPTFRGGSATFVGVHVRRTDYINWIQSRYKGRQVEASFFLHCIAEFLAQFPDAVFLVELSTNLRDVLQFLLERF